MIRYKTLQGVITKCNKQELKDKKKVLKKFLTVSELSDKLIKSLEGDIKVTTKVVKENGL